MNRLQRWFGWFVLLIWLIAPKPVWANPVNTPLEVVTTTTDLKSLVDAVGGDRVHTVSIALPAQDPHAFEPRPGDVQRVKGAQMVVKIGLDHDLWIDQLLAESGNSTIQRNGLGYVDTSVGIPLLEMRSTTIAPMAGHNHGAGNPHYWLDPLNTETMTGAILDGLSQLDPEHANLYEQNRKTFLAQLHEKVADWEQQLAPYHGKPILVYHNSWPYLSRRFRLNVVDYIEPKPGIPPSPTHLATLLKEMKQEQISLIIKEPYESDQVPRLLSQKTGAAIATLISSVGAVPQAQDYFSLMDYNVTTLVEAWHG